MKLGHLIVKLGYFIAKPGYLNCRLQYLICRLQHFIRRLADLVRKAAHLIRRGLYRIQPVAYQIGRIAYRGFARQMCVKLPAQSFYLSFITRGDEVIAFRKMQNRAEDAECNPQKEILIRKGESQDNAEKRNSFAQSAADNHRRLH